MQFKNFNLIILDDTDSPFNTKGAEQGSE